MPEEDEVTVTRKGRLPGWVGPAVMLGGSVLSMATVFLPWARLDVTDPSVQVRNGWYTGWELALPVALLFLMLVPVVFSIIMLTGKGSANRRLEVGFCSFVLGMEFMFLCTLLALAFVLDYIADSVDLFKFGLGAGFWAASFLFAVTVLGLVLCGRGSQPDRRAGSGESD